MQLVFAFLADAAKFTTDGKVGVLGGDFDTVFASDFPAQHIGAVLVVKLRVQPTECNRNHALRVEFIDSDGTPVVPTLEVPFNAKPREDQPHRPVGVGLALEMQAIPIPREGEYGFHILVDDHEMAVVQLFAVRRDEQPTLPGISPLER
jgi:hypothetical protein